MLTTKTFAGRNVKKKTKGFIFPCRAYLKMSTDVTVKTQECGEKHF
jgi:hypothetical protein